MSTKNEKFIAELKAMNKIMKKDLAEGHQWTYCNKSGKKSKDFDTARKEGKYKLNCVDGVQWGLKRAGIPSSALSWYGGMGGPVWLNPNAEKNCAKYFDIIHLNMTVSNAIKNNRICEGDILIYTTMSHTDAYLGWGKSFDTGHAYCTGSGEGAKFHKWIGATPCKSQKISYVLRLKSRVHYRLISGVYEIQQNAIERANLIKEKYGINAAVNEIGGLYKVQLGYFDGLCNAEAKQTEYAKRGIATFIAPV